MCVGRGGWEIGWLTSIPSSYIGGVFVRLLVIVLRQLQSLAFLFGPLCRRAMVGLTGELASSLHASPIGDTNGECCTNMPMMGWTRCVDNRAVPSSSWSGRCCCKWQHWSSCLCGILRGRPGEGFAIEAVQRASIPHPLPPLSPSLPPQWEHPPPLSSTSPNTWKLMITHG